MQQAQILSALVLQSLWIAAYEIKKKLLEAGKEAFPDIPIEAIFDSISEKGKAKMRKKFEEIGEDFDLLEKWIRKKKTLGDSDVEKINKS